MTKVVFYGKPGCVTNARQQALLCALGHHLEVRDLLQEPWTAASLRPFFGTRPVSDWFNPTAPRIKSGEVLPAALDEDTALALMVADRLLIRRPLIAIPEGLCSGFDPGPVLDALGLAGKVAPGARSNSPSPSGRGRGEGTAMAPATFMVRGGAGAMAVSLASGEDLQSCSRPGPIGCPPPGASA